ncbi:MAG: hypothetical protein ACFFCJ_02060 [Promethearchaeota archaeon]
MKAFKNEDDYLHKPTKHTDWRESFYFNWVDLKAQVSGFTTIGIVPNVPRREFVFALFVEGRPEFYFTETKESIPTEFHAAMGDETLVYELVKPHTDWRIHYTNPRLSAEIQWQSRFPPGDFGKGSGTSWGRHFEQSGHIKGHVKYPDGRVHHFAGLGQRDKSWGVRNWHIDQWFALHAQFDEMMIGLRIDTVKGKTHQAGIISSEKENIPIVKASFETEFEEEAIQKPVKAITKVVDTQDQTYTIISKPIHPNAFARYARPYKSGETELFEIMVVHECEELNETGTGLTEWLFTHP